MTRTRIETGDAPHAMGPYSQGLASGDLVFCSGQVGLDPATGQAARRLRGPGRACPPQHRGRPGGGWAGLRQHRQDDAVPDRHRAVPGRERDLQDVLPGPVPGPLDGRRGGAPRRRHLRDRGHRDARRRVAPLPRAGTAPRDVSSADRHRPLREADGAPGVPPGVRLAVPAARDVRPARPCVPPQCALRRLPRAPDGVPSLPGLASRCV